MRSTRPVRCLCWLLMLGVVWGCGDAALAPEAPAEAPGCVDLAGDGCGDDAGAAPVDAGGAAAPCEAAAAGVTVRGVQATPRPGGGVTLGLQAVAADGAPADPAALAECLELRAGGEGRRLEAILQPVRPEEVQTLILLWPGASPAAAVEQARALVAELGPAERVGVVLGSAGGLRSWADLGPAQGGLRRRLEALPALEPAPPAALQAQVQEAATRLGALGTPGARVARRLVVIAPELRLTAWPLLDAPGISARWRVAAAPPPIPWMSAAPSLGELGAQLRAEVERGFYAAHVCPGATRAVVSVEAGGRSLGAALLPPGAVSGACALEPPGPDARGAWLALELDPDQREVYAARVGALSQEPFALQVRAEGAAPQAASAHLRGQSSLGCDRKSYAVELDAGALPWLPGLERDEALLIAMCLDRRYINQLTADAVMADLGLFPMRHGLREVRLGDVSQGVYLIADSPESWARRSQLDLRAVIRRRLDTDGKPPEVKQSWPDDASALEAYDGLLAAATTTEGPARLEALDRRMDLDSYLRWMALMSLLQNGDYVDELWFIGTPAEPEGAALWFGVVGWDPDDLFSACHHGGRFALTDPYGLLYCAESLLDHAIFGDPAVYRRYAAILKELLASLPPERFTATLESTGERLLDFLERDAVRGAMVELLRDHPEAASAEGARAVIIDGLSGLDQSYRARHAELTERLAVWEAAP